MTMKEKLLMLWLFVVVIVTFVVTHMAGHLAFAIENYFAVVLSVLRA